MSFKPKAKRLVKLIRAIEILSLLFVVLLLSSCNTENNKAEKQDDPILALPLTFHTGYDNFKPSYKPLLWKDDINSDAIEGFYKDTYKKIDGISDEWKDFGINRIRIVNQGQFFYQNFKQGKISPAFYTAMMSAYEELDSINNLYSPKDLKSSITLVIYRDKNDELFYKIDTNHDNSVRDEIANRAVAIDYSDLNLQAKRIAHDIWYEVYKSDSIQKVNTKIAVYLYKDRTLAYNFPTHASAKLDTLEFSLNHGFFSPGFKYKTDITFFDTTIDKDITVKKNDYFKIDNGTTFKNLGVRNNHLYLYKVPADSIIHSAEVGFYPPELNEANYLTKDSIHLKDFKGKYLYLDFWGSWCAPCIKEIPNLKHTYKNIDKSKIEFLGLAYDSKTEDLLIKALEKYKLEWPQILMSEDLKKMYNISKFPTSFLLNPKGKIIAKDLRGEHLFDTLNYYIRKL